jgi:hypothetical protein
MQQQKINDICFKMMRQHDYLPVENIWKMTITPKNVIINAPGSQLADWVDISGNYFWMP